MMIKELLRRPLEQAMGLLWLLTLVHLVNRIAADQLSVSWVVSASLAGLMTLFLAARYHLLSLIALPILLELAAYLALLSLLGFKTHALALAALVFALLLWGFCRYTVGRPLYRRLHDLLRLNFYHERDIGVERIVLSTHKTLFLIAAGAVLVQLRHGALFNVAEEHSLPVLATLLLAMWLAWLNRQRYRVRLNAYLMLVSAILAVIEGLSLTVHPVCFLTLASDRYAGLLFIFLGLSMWGGHYSLRWLATSDRALFRQPIRVTAMVSAMLGCLLQFHYFMSVAQGRVSLLDIIVFFTAGALLLTSNHRLKWPLLNGVALLLMVTAALWLIFRWLHPSEAFSLWPGPQTFSDQWFSLGLLSLLLSSLSLRFENSRPRLRIYCRSLSNIALATYLWTLLGALQLFFHDPYSGQQVLPGLWLVLLCGQMPVLCRLPYAAQIRGIAIVPLLLCFQLSLLAAFDRLEALRWLLALTAYMLLIVSTAGLAQWNRTFPRGAVSPGFWPWAGLMLIYTALLQGGPVWIFEWPWLLTAVVYQLALRNPYLDVPAILLGVLSLLWAQSTLLHPAFFSLWPGFETTADLWFSLSVFALLFSILSDGISAAWAIRFKRPLRQTALLCYIWSLTGDLALFIAAADSPLLPAIFLLQLLALFSLSSLWPAGAWLRGIGSGTLLTLLLISCVRLLDLPVLTTLLSYNYLLWWLSCQMIPRFNQKFPALAVEAQSWAWIGLLLMFACGTLLTGFAELETVLYLLTLSCYCVLMRHYSSATLLNWLGALCFALAGPAFAAIYWRETDLAAIDLPPIELFFNAGLILLLWVNLQLVLVRLWRNFAKIQSHSRSWFTVDLSAALLFFADALLLGHALCYGYYVFGYSYLIPVPIDQEIRVYAIAVGLLLCLSFIHAIGLSCRIFRVHGLMLSGYSLAWAVYFAFPLPFLHPPLYLAICCMMLVAVYYWVYSSRIRQYELTGQVLGDWARFGLISATGGLLFVYDYTLPSRLTDLGVVTVVTGFFGLWTLNWKWFTAACLEFLLLLHGWPFLWLSLDQIDGLYPWFALQAAALAWLFLLLIERFSLPSRIESTDDGRKAMTHLVLHYWPWLVAAALSELLFHFVLLQRWLMMSVEPLWLLPPLDSLAALAAGLIVAGMGVRHVRRGPDSRWVYGIVLLMALLGFYLRLLILGIAPVGFWDTALLIVFAYVLLLLHRSFPSRPLLNLALLMPLFALLTVPLQLESPEASLTLMVTGVFYLLIRRNAPQRQLPVYLALLAFNSGVYLWVPGIVEHSHLLQVYVIPVALSILVLLQLHRRELKQNVLMASRLAALSVIYAAATLDVFLLPDVEIFMLAMGLSLAGLILGIALRVRAYLYAGVCFLLLNVSGQFVNYYPEQMLGKAIVLMILGSLIIASMIWFNIKRAEILRQFRNIQDELESWE